MKGAHDVRIAVIVDVENIVPHNKNVLSNLDNKSTKGVEPFVDNNSRDVQQSIVVVIVYETSESTIFVRHWVDNVKEVTEVTVSVQR